MKSSRYNLMVLFPSYSGHSSIDGSVHFSNPKRDFVPVLITRLQACDAGMLNALGTTLVGNSSVWKLRN